jgi:hypothetical protein
MRGTISRFRKELLKVVGQHFMRDGDKKRYAQVFVRGLRRQLIWEGEFNGEETENHHAEVERCTKPHIYTI